MEALYVDCDSADLEYLGGPWRSLKDDKRLRFNPNALVVPCPSFFGELLRSRSLTKAEYGGGKRGFKTLGSSARA